MTNAPYDLSTPMNLAKIVGVYEDLRALLPAFEEFCRPNSVYADTLSDLLDHFDAVLLDGFGVLNIGVHAILGADRMLASARQKNVTPIVLTNSASKTSQTAGMKYKHLGLDIQPDDVISSRAALLDHLTRRGQALSRFGVIDSFTDLPIGLKPEMLALSPDQPDDWLACDSIGFFGTVNWSGEWQTALMKAMAAEISIMVANPDVAAPHQPEFSREPAFWVAKAIHDLGIPLADAKVDWFGKPHSSVFDLALARLEHHLGHTGLDRKRIAMVGDTLHTDILGGHAAGLSTVLVTGHGLFRDGGAEDTIASVGITPDYIVKTV